jgi:hypothetical protein
MAPRADSAAELTSRGAGGSFRHDVNEADRGCATAADGGRRHGRVCQHVRSVAFADPGGWAVTERIRIALAQGCSAQPVKDDIAA